MQRSVGMCWLALCLAAACSATMDGADEGIAGMGDPTGGGGSDTPPVTGACEGPLGPPITDLSSLASCCEDKGGAGHCLDASKVPAEAQPFLEACTAGGLCVPDKILGTGGAEPLDTCTAFGGDGVCMSLCVPQVYEIAGLLQQDACDADELCVPCIDPRTGMSSGACELPFECVNDQTGGTGGGGTTTPACDDPATCEYEASCPPVLDPAILPRCADDAHCLDRTLIEGVAPDVVNLLAPCADTTQLCVPDTFLSTGGKFLPPTCRSLADSEGRCLSLVLPQVSAQESLLPQSTCAASEKCVPCFNPLDALPTGACSTPCDTGPTEPAKAFPACCDSRAKCVPTAAIPDEQEGNLSDDDCTEGNLCVPNEILAGATPPLCNASGFLIGDYTGVCLSDCLDFGFVGIVLGQGNCGGDYKCAPCNNPLTGAPTGAPGCPGT